MKDRRRPGRGRRGSQMGVVEIFTRPDLHPVMRVLGWVVRYRAELTTIAVLVTAALLVRAQVGPDYATIILVAVAGMVFTIPASRRHVTRRFWCVHARHRARTCFVQTRTMTYDGRMPFLYWSRPSPVGERLRVWLPAGLAVKDLEQACEQLAVACWARSARIQAHRRWSQLAIIEIVRRDPLGTADVITPAVLHGIPADDTTAGTGDAVVVPLPTRITLPVPAPREEQPRPARRTPATPRRADTGHHPNGTGLAVTGFGGVDVSDYV